MDRNPVLLYKTLVVGVIFLFLGVAIQPSVAVQPETEIDIEPKDYLFQTIIDIANNPEVKELFEQYKPDMFKVDIDRSVYRQILLRNPRLIFNTLFTKPPMSVEYLNKCYNNGVEITNILGEDKVIETIENFEVTDTKLFDGLNNIISKDEELSERLETLKVMNRNSITDTLWENTPIICSILFIICFIPIAIGSPAAILLQFIDEVTNPILYLLASLWLLPIEIFVIIPAFLFLAFGCIDLNPY